MDCQSIEVQDVQCGLCGSGRYRTILEEVRSGLVLRAVRCEDCGFVYTNPRLKQSAVRDLYSREHYEGKESASGLYCLRAESAESQYRQGLWALSKHKKEGKLLDIGCGAGYFLQVAKCRGWTVSGTELSEFAADLARKNAQCDIYVGDLRSGIIEETVFDVVTMWYVLEHVVDPQQLLEESWKVLKEDGLLLVAVPNVEYLLAKARFIRLLEGGQNALHLEEHLQHFSLRTLGRMLMHSGFSVVEELVAKPFDIRGRVLSRVQKTIGHYLASLLFFITGHNLGGLLVIAKKTSESSHLG